MGEAGQREIQPEQLRQGQRGVGADIDDVRLRRIVVKAASSRAP